MNVGIDYGRGLVNVDQKTGIRFGVIHSGELGQAWYDSCEGDYGKEHCPECDNAIHTEHANGQLFCVHCQATWDYVDVFPESPIAWVYEDDQYSMEQGGDDCDVFVTRSPFYTLCSFCSPCAPGAGYIMSQNPEGVRAFCPGHDWFEEHDRTPIRIWSVESGLEVIA